MTARLTLPWALTAWLCIQAAGVAAQTPVSVVEPETGQSEETLRLTGNLTARQLAGLSAQEAGLIATLHVDTGDTVEAGDGLVELDTGLVELDVERARAAREQARASLAEARRLAAEARELGNDRFFPETELRAREAAATLAQAALDRAQSELARERERLERHRVEAPFAGVISDRFVERGEWVEPGTAVVELVRVDELWLDVRVPQRYWADLGRAGDLAVRAFADVDPDRALDTRIHARVPVSDPTARTFLLRLLIDDESGDLTPGMSASVELTLRRDETTQRVPRDAVLRYPDGTTTVWIVEGGENRVREVEVALRRSVGERVELKDRLPEGARVVVRGNEVLSEGESVRIVDESGR